MLGIAKYSKTKTTFYKTYFLLNPKYILEVKFSRFPTRARESAREEFSARKPNEMGA